MATTDLGKRAQRLTGSLILRELGRRDVNDFCEYAMTGADGRPWVQQPFHREWQELLPVQGPARVLIGAPRESAKTTQLAVARVIWELGRNPDLRVKIVTASDNLAGDIVGSIARHISANPRVREVFPNLRPASQGLWPKPGAQTTRLMVARRSREKDPSVAGHGIMSAGVGGRADLIIFDDVVDFRNAVGAPAMRKQVGQSFFEAWLNLLGPQGRAVYIATVWHQDDLTMELRGNPEWRVWWRAARDEVTGQLLWPQRWDAEALARREREIGRRAFARQFLLVPLSDEDYTFSPEVIDRCRDTRFAPAQVQVPDDWPRYAGVDLASSLGQKASYTVMFTVAVDPDTKRRYPLEIIRRRQLFPATIQMIKDSYQRWHHTAIYVESNAFQEAVVHELRSQNCSMPVQSYTTGQQKTDESVGIPSLSAGMASGGWVIPAAGEPHEPRCECGWCAWVRELRLHPGGEHSDVLMAMWFAETAARSRRAAPRIRWLD
jgi:hypothetical protein